MTPAQQEGEIFGSRSRGSREATTIHSSRQGPQQFVYAVIEFGTHHLHTALVASARRRWRDSREEASDGRKKTPGSDFYHRPPQFPEEARHSRGGGGRAARPETRPRDSGAQPDGHDRRRSAHRHPDAGKP